MKKKLLTVTVGTCLMLALAGCGAKETTSNENVAETAVEVAEETTEYGTEETTEVVEETTVAEETATETVVEEQTTETTETVEETVTEETTEEVTETADNMEGYPMAFASDDPRTSTVADVYESIGKQSEYDSKVYCWNDGASPVVVISSGTKDIEDLNAVLAEYGDTPGVFEYFGTVSTTEGEKEVMLCVGCTVEGQADYIYEFGGYTVKICDQHSQINSVEDLQHYVDLIRFE